MKKYGVGSSEEVPAGPCAGRVHHPANGPNGIELDVIISPEGRTIDVMRRRGGESAPLKIIFARKVVSLPVPSIHGHALRFFFTDGTRAIIDMITGKKWIGKIPEFVISD